MVTKLMNRLAIILISLLILQPMQFESNPIYRASNGDIGIGSWFYYMSNFTAAENRTYNYTITYMSDYEITYNITSVYQSGYTARTIKTVDLRDTFRIDFWIDINSYADQLRRLNSTSPTIEITVRTWIYFVNDTYIHYLVKTSSAYKDIFDEEIIVTNQYGVITYTWINKTVVTKSVTTIRFTEHRLIDWKYQNIEQRGGEKPPENNFILIATATISILIIVLAMVAYLRKVKRHA